MTPYIVRLAAAAAAAMLMSCAGATDRIAARADTERGRPVKVEPVRRQEIRRTIEVVGTLAASDEVTVSAEVEGKVSRILADLGDRVHRGQALVELDAEKLRYRVDEQRAAFNRARAKYGVSQTDGSIPVSENTPDVQKAAANLAQAELSLKRADELHRRALLPRQQLDDAEAAYRSAKATYEAALQNSKDLRADIDASEANLRLAERELRDTEIRAPFDGYIQQRLVAPGQYVKVQSPIVSLVRVNPLKLTAEVPERLAPWVKVGQPVDVSVDAFPNRAIEGIIQRISPAVNQQTRAFPLEARVPNESGQLKPGTFARVRIQSGKVDQVITVPVSALQYRYGVNRAFVVKDDRLVSRELKLGDRLEERVEVLSGLEAGEPVVIGDIEKLADGLRVTSQKGS